MTHKYNNNEEEEEVGIADILYSLHSVNPFHMEEDSDQKAEQFFFDDDHKKKCSPIVKDTLSCATTIIGGSKSVSSDDGNEWHNEQEKLVTGIKFKGQWSSSSHSYDSNSIQLQQEAANKKRTVSKRPKMMMSCECGAIILARSHWKHSKSQKHIDFCALKRTPHENQQVEGDSNHLQTSSSHPTLSAEDIIILPPHNKRQKTNSSLLQTQQQEEDSEPSSSSTSSLSTSTSRTSSEADLIISGNSSAITTATVPATGFVNHPDTVYQLVYPQTMQYPSQQLLHYQQGLFPNQLVWVQHPFYSYPMMLMVPSSSSSTSSPFTPQPPQPSSSSWYHMPPTSTTSITDAAL